MSGIRFVLFDLGGVLVDYDHRISTRAMAPLCDTTEDELFRSIFDSGLEDALDAGEISFRDFHEDIRRRTGYRGSLAELRESWGNIFAPKPESIALAARLAAAGVPLGIVSNTNEVHLEYAGRLVDFSGLFRWMFVSFRLRCRKPSPAYYEAVSGRIPFPAAEGIFIDDRRENLPPASAQGWKTHLFREAALLADELSGLDDFPRIQAGKE